MEYYYSEDKSKVAILVSHGYGNGWSTWEDSNLAWDKRVVEYVMRHMDNEKWRNYVGIECTTEYKEMTEFLYSIGYRNDMSLKGLERIAVEWVPIGAHFIIKEYDGNEYVEYRDQTAWMVFESEE